MPNDNKPDPRFAMIAEEMTTEVKPAVIEATIVELKVTPRGQSTFSSTVITCPRCGLGAFEPIRVDGKAMVRCLACPLPSPTYDLPSGAALETNRYRCSSCGLQSQVTMTLSDVNLHCNRCGKLTLHSQQVDPKPGTSPWLRGSEINQRATFQWEPATERALASAAERALSRIQAFASSVTPSAAGDYDIDVGKKDRMQFLDFVRERLGDDTTTRESSVVLPPATATDARTDRLVEYLRDLLGFENFDAFAERTRNFNISIRKIPWTERDRRTGRTIRGVVETLARCGVERTRRLYVRAANQRHEAELCALFAEFRVRAKMEIPIDVTAMPRGVPSERLQEFAGRFPNTLLYIDHSYRSVARFAPEFFEAGTGNIYKP